MIGTLLGALAASTCAAPQEPANSTIQVPAATTITGTFAADVDGDGRRDLVLACRSEAKGPRTLRVHLRQDGAPAFGAAPSRPPIELDRDVVAFTWCDVDPAPGLELVLLTPEQVVAVLPGDGGAPRFERLLRHTLVWPAADPGEALPLPDAAADVDGDGRPDLLLPSPDAWSLWLARPDGTSPRFTELVLRVPPRENAFAKALQGSAFSGGDTFSLRLGDGPPSSGSTLVRAATRTPPCARVDLDGDGRIDLAAWRNGRLFGASAKPEWTALDRMERAMPLPPDRLQIADPAFDVQFTDLDGDGRADLLLTTTAKRDDDLESRVDWFFTRGDGTWPEREDGRLRLQPLAGPPRLVDVDGDGRRDLVCLSLRTSAMRGFTGDAASALDAQLTIFRAGPSGFVRPPLWNRPIALAAGSQRLAQPFLEVRPGRNGTPGDVLLRTEAGLERRPFTRRDDALQMEAATGRAPLPEQCQLVVDDVTGEVLVVTEGELRVVRFSR